MSVTVVGSLNEDVLVRVGRLPGRGETVIGRDARVAPGGKGANQAAAAGRLGTGVHMVGRVGEDPAGERQLAGLAEVGVDVGRVHRTPGALTGSATIPVEEGTGENLIVVVPGANAALTPAARSRTTPPSGHSCRSCRPRCPCRDGFRPFPPGTGPA